jgi:small subunit ribosomal protein S1
VPTKVKKTITKAAKTPTTMEELLALAEFTPKGISRGQIIEGTIVSASPHEVLVDIGGKSEGIISGRELSEFPTEFKPGDKVLAYIMQSEDESGQTVLSLKRAGGEKRWRELEEEFKKSTPVEVRGMETNRGGLVVDIEGVRGFIPSSQLDSANSGSSGIGKKFQAKIIEFDRRANRLILSQKTLTAEANRRKFEDAAGKFKSGETLTGKVSGVMPYGLFVSLEEGIEGLVHISEVGWERIANLAEVYKIGDEVKVKILNVDPSAGRINLSIKALAEDPWKEKIKEVKAGETVEGEVTKITQFGVFVKLPQGIDGLIQSNKIPPYMIDLKPGAKFKVTVETVNPESHKISLIVAEEAESELKPIEELVSDSFTEASKPALKSKKDKKIKE